MWYTTRHEEGEGAVSRRQASVPGFHIAIMDSMLRVGLSLLGITSVMFLVAAALFGAGLFYPDLQGATEELLASCYPRVLALLAAMRLIGSIYVFAFHALVADDAAQARGFAAGSKVCGLACFFLILGSVFQLVAYIWLSNNFTPLWLESFQAGGSEWLFLSAGRLFFALGVVKLGVASFLLESFSESEVNDAITLIGSMLYFAAGAVDIAGIFQHQAIGSILTAIAFLVGVLRAARFESSLNKIQVTLQETEMVTEVEQEVAKYAQLSPYNIHA